MFEEKRAKKYGDFYVKSYKTDKNIYDVLEAIVHSNLPYEIVTVSEDQDVGLKMFNGDYRRNDFLEEYNSMKFAAKDYTFTLANGDFIRIIIETNSILVGSRNENIDFNRIMSIIIGDSDKLSK